ncbi:hypothetical protein T4B_1367 [Trichinella pseudospiralis]|uniref:Uncharacterized protein n=1 Tax=Trichinella pseudospiralis TaxID=6337 RepID=A0A0V1IG03_TRIPS|nr:hypothetical protein T4B_1367 [Trichinella pseudospiralis]
MIGQFRLVQRVEMQRIVCYDKCGQQSTYAFAYSTHESFKWSLEVVITCRRRARCLDPKKILSYVA